MEKYIGQKLLRVKDRNLLSFTNSNWTPPSAPPALTWVVPATGGADVDLVRMGLTLQL
jgi:hypothetical protein